MPKITDVVEQKKDKNRVSIYLDGEFYCGLMREAAVKSLLKIGDEVSLENINSIRFESEKLTAFDKAIEYLSRSMKTRKQIFEYLKKKQYSDETIKYTIEKLQGYNYINDEEYAHAYVRTYSNRYGEHKIRYELKLKGVAEPLIENALKDVENSDTLLALAEKYMRNKTVDYATRGKLFKHLVSKGFDFDDIKAVISKIYDGEDYE